MPRKSTSQAFSVFETEDTAQTEEKETEYLLVNEESPEYLKKVDLIDAIRQAPNKAARREAMAFRPA
ncbi:hypothetical protein [Anabaena sp. UHCC 0399]|uniref:hypothetical protein n=1 Tax=Anabaena sp. UHCC 0399 TaxID=3110238 RepID=UPI002B202C51|nr:hypothetical protein [Anabaena sp. UHCC 0399]MEA5566131.1 hypothetical protein [Anabaena sp. UHCC 0399]